jgi:hypothetical protein
MDQVFTPLTLDHYQEVIETEQTPPVAAASIHPAPACLTGEYVSIIILSQWHQQVIPDDFPRGKACTSFCSARVA